MKGELLIMMKKTTNEVLKKCSDTAAKLALTVTSLNVNAACGWVMHQPELPKGAEKLKKHDTQTGL